MAVWILNMDVRYHQQDTEKYCGAAVAQMVRDTRGQGLANQFDLFRDGQQHFDPATWGTGWGMDPESVKSVLNGKTFGGTGSFSVVAMEDPKAWTLQILSMLHKHKVPIPVLVYKKAEHWVLVKGMKMGAIVGAIGSRGNVLLGVYIHNPWPPVPSSCSTLYQNRPPPPHSYTDTCGKSAQLNNKMYGIPNEYLTYDGAWLNDYVTGTVFTPGGKSLVVAVCYSKLKLLKPLKGIELAEPMIYKAPISPDKIVKLLSQEIDRHDLLHDDSFSAALDNAEPSDPILVRRLNREDSYYYLVPMKKGRSVTAIITLDANRGTLDGCMAYPEPVEEPFISLEAVKAKITGLSVKLPGKKSKCILREGTFEVQPTMVWKPCKESLSPYYPLHEITTKYKHVIYTDYLGNVHTSLHDEGPFG